MFTFPYKYIYRARNSSEPIIMFDGKTEEPHDKDRMKMSVGIYIYIFI